MSTRNIIIGLVVCLSIAVSIDQTLSQTPRSKQTARRPDLKRLRNMTPEQRQKELEQRMRKQRMETQQRLKQRIKEREQNREQRQRDSQKRQEQSMKEALGVTEEQWKLIKPRLEKVQNLARQANISISLLSYGTGSGSGRRSSSNRGRTGGYGGGGGSSVNVRTAPSKPSNEEKYSSSQSGWRWYRPSERKAPDKLTEGERICEELLKLIGDKNSRPEEIEQKMEALRKIRQEAKKQLAKAQQELREVLTFHQEAALIMMRRLY